ncbi:MAG TPA: hypothetical protein VGC13_29390 [Longimicrobium sp.]|jgi:hypothetical protein|uniref:hypothetical protein n=1 Tax=Longimicrobium sp. TaxID=2029185 RepID=UPI002ED8A537
MKTVITVLLACAVSAPAARAQTLDDAIARFHRDATDQRVLDDFQAVVDAHPDDPDTRAWYAEALLHHDALRTAAREAHRVLEAAPCHGMANAVLARVHLASAEPDAADSAGAYAERATTCAPDDGNAWLAAWDAAALRNDEAAELRAQRRLGELGFFGPPVLELARWTLRAAPPAAVLFAGDWNYHPLQVAQTAEGVRPDVTIVRLSHLSIPAYVRRMAARTGYPVPPEAEGVDGGAPVHQDDGPAPLQSAVGALWAQARVEGGNPRPLALAATADQRFIDSGVLLRREGPVITVNPSGRLSDPLFLPAAFTAAWEDLDLRRMAGPLTSAGDRSPARRTDLHPLEAVVAILAVYAEYQGRRGETDSARQALGWAQQVMDTRGPRPEIQELLDQARRSIGP